MLGILDSGIGGLVLVKRVIERLPDCNIVYFGDTARSPYGDKSPETIARYARQNMGILLRKGAKAVLIASHTVACIVGRQLGESFRVPVLGVTEPTIRMALQTTSKSVIGIMGSRAAAGRNGYAEAIQRLNSEVKVYSAACPLLPALVEEGWLKKPETVRIVKKYLHPLKVRQIDTLVLGGNHCSLLIKIIQRKVGKRVRVIDACRAVPAALVDLLEKNEALKRAVCRNGDHQFLVSDLNEHLLQTARRIFGGNIALEVLSTPETAAG